MLTLIPILFLAWAVPEFCLLKSPSLMVFNLFRAILELFMCWTGDLVHVH